MRARIWKRWRRWGLVLGIFALGIPATAGLLVRSGTSRERLHDLATAAIRNELGLRASIGRVQLQLVPLALVAHDITLDDPIYGRFAEANELRITPGFRALLRGGLDLQEITIRGATVRLVVRNGQIRNLPRAEGGGGPDGAPELPFDELHVLDATLIVDAMPHAAGQLSNVDLHLLSTDGGFSLQTSSHDGWVRHDAGRERIESIDAHVEYTETELRVSRVALRTPDIELTVEDAAAPLTFGDHGYRGRVQLAYDLAHLARLPWPEEITVPPADGRVRADLRFASEGREQRVAGTIDLEEVHVEQWGFGQSAHLLVEANPRVLRVLEGSRAVNAHGRGTMDLLAEVTLDEDAGFPLTASAHFQDFSFGALMNNFGVTENGIVDWILSGDAGLRGQLVPLRLAGPVSFATRDFQVSHNPYHSERVRRVISVSHGQFDGRWSVRPDAIRFHDLVGQLPRTRLRGDVLLGFDNKLEVHATADNVDLRDITPLDRWPIAGAGRARCDITGTYQDPVVRGHVELSDFVFDQFRLGNFQTDAVLDPDGMGVRFPMVEAQKSESRYRAEDLYLDFHDNRFAMTGGLHLEGMRLADFYHVFGFHEDERFTGYEGLVRGRAGIRYTNGFPDDSPSGTLDVDMQLGFDWARLDGFHFDAGQLVGRWRWLDWSRGAAGAELTLAHLSLRKGNGTLNVEGRMRLGGELQMDAVADRIALHDLEGIGDRFPQLDGVATVIGRVGGTVSSMQNHFDVGVTNVTYDGQPLGDGRFYVRMTDQSDPYVSSAGDWTPETTPPNAACPHARTGLARANWPSDPPMRTIEGPLPRLERPSAFLVCGSGLDGRLVVDAAVGRTSALPVRGSIRLDALDLSSVLGDVVGDDDLVAALSGELLLTGGAMRQPETLRGDLRLSDVHVGLDDLEIRNRREVSLSFADGVLTVNRARFIGPESRLRVRGHASLGEGYALRVNSNADLGLIARLTRTVSEASGRLRAELQVSGPIEDPELYGEASVENGTFRFASFEPVLERVSGHIRFSQRSVLFEGFTGEVAGGRIAATGSAELQGRGIERYAFDVDARGLSYDFREGVEMSFGAATTLSWRRGERLPTLGGELIVNRFEYSRPIALRGLGDITASAVRGLVRQSRTEVQRYDPEQDSIALDLRVTQTAPLRVQNNLITADLRIQSRDRGFRIVGTDQRYGMRGAMRITSGQLFFQNNEFNVRRGLLEFDDETRIDPHVNVEAVTEIRRTSDLSGINWRVILRLTGSADNLRLETDSDPDLPEPDILMLLAFGMTRSELQQLQAGDVGGVAALEALTAVSGVDREIRRALPLIDDIHLTSGYSQRTGRSEPRLSVGKRIADRVRLSATTGLGEGREFRGALEWQLPEGMRLGVSYDNYNLNGANAFGNLGVDWGFRLEFE